MKLFYAFLLPSALGLLLVVSATGQTPSPVVPPANSRTLAPVTFEAKTKWWAKETFGVDALVGSAIPAAFRMLNPPRAYPREWRQGAEGYGRNVGQYYAMNATAYTAKFAVSALLREDPRYHPSSDTQFTKRLGHALASNFIARGDNGNLRPAVSTWAGALAGGFVTKAYMPNGFNNSVHAGQWTLINFGQLAAGNLTDEFRPEFRKLAKKLHLPFAK